MHGIVFSRCDLGDGSLADVRIERDAVVAVGEQVTAEGDEVIDCAGGALMPGLHDHHIHLLSLAASLASLDVGPPAVNEGDAFKRALETAPGRGWIRAINYHESVAGDLDRSVLDAIVRDRPVRVQHRSGAMWVLNSRGLELAGIASDTGRLFRADVELRRLPHDVPDLAPVGRLLSQAGVTGVTDATVDLGDEGAAILTEAVTSGVLPLQVNVLGAVVPES